MISAATDGAFAVSRKRGSAPVLSAKRTAYRFDRQEIIDALQRWRREFGEPPRGIDLEPARARRFGQAWRADRFESGDWPSARMVTKQFGSLTAALEAAGLAGRPAPNRTAANLSSPSAILEAIRSWARRYGEVPTLADWDPARARRLNQDWRIARYYRGDWPSTRTVIVHFGSMSNAIREAGLQPRAVGSHGNSRLRERVLTQQALAAVLATEAAAGDGRELSRAVRAVAEARRREDPVALRRALIELAAHALAWAEHTDMQAPA